ncbi:hypothetical protein BpHYR1_051410 [Brachionus plicatilis]|uniref:Uncharacterized protein n=1 Tax=Brachionus plicatilis TaxID=10195 RepID=A0A3M7S2I4_BRAPC|nr:hypothetical protein BpHYR1_051410 [Brachionus plicatilis]
MALKKLQALNYPPKGSSIGNFQTVPTGYAFFSVHIWLLCLDVECKIEWGFALLGTLVRYCSLINLNSALVHAKNSI